MAIWSDSKLTWLALKMIPNLGNITYKRLLDRFGDPDTVFEAELGDLVKVDGLRVETAKRIINRAWEGEPEEELSALQKGGIRLITMEDPSYPVDLREIYDPPPFLYVLCESPNHLNKQFHTEKSYPYQIEKIHWPICIALSGNPRSCPSNLL